MSLKLANPGDLITSIDWNELIDAINDLESRVASLESGGTSQAPHITDVLPSGPVTEGDTIRIFGSYFDFIKGGATVYFGNTPVAGFLGGSSDTLLIVQVPDEVDGASDVGTAMTLTVGNLVGFTTRAITVKNKPDVLTGGVEFTYKGSTPTTPAQKADIDYNFELKSIASQDLTVTIAPTIAPILPLPNGMVDPNLPSHIKVIDADQTVKSNGQIALAEGTTKNISLRLSLPDQTNGLKYKLSATASAPGIITVNENVPDQQVGQEGEQPDPTVGNFDNLKKVAGTVTISSDTGGVQGVDGTISVKKNSTGKVQVRTEFKNIAPNTTNHYQLDASIDNPANGWSSKVDDVMQNPLPVASPGGLINIIFDLTAPNTTDTAVVRLTLTNQDANKNNKRSVAYRLVTQ